MKERRERSLREIDRNMDSNVELLFFQSFDSRVFGRIASNQSVSARSDQSSRLVEKQSL